MMASAIGRTEVRTFPDKCNHVHEELHISLSDSLCREMKELSKQVQKDIRDELCRLLQDRRLVDFTHGAAPGTPTAWGSDEKGARPPSKEHHLLPAAARQITITSEQLQLPDPERIA